LLRLSEGRFFWYQARKAGPAFFTITFQLTGNKANKIMAFDMMGMMGKVKELQDKMQQAQGQLQHITATGEAGGGLVKATANGHRTLVKLEIDSSLLTPEDREMLPDLVVAAVNKALETAGEMAKSELQRQTSGLLPNLPGLDLNNFGI